MEKKRVPNFLLAGAGESGTSWLYACLLQHPQVYMPKVMRPEPHYFYKSWEYQKGFGHYLSSFFDQVPPTAKAIGERSSSYLFGPDVAKRIQKDLPNIKLIFMLRDPVDRAYSNWRFSVQSGFETEPFEQAIELEAQRTQEEKDPVLREIQPFAYLGRGMYGPQLKTFLEFFTKDQMLILNSDWVKKHEPETLKKVCSFLDIDPSFSFENPGTFPTSSVKNRVLHGALRKLFDHLGYSFDASIEMTRSPGTPQDETHTLLIHLLKENLTRDHPPMCSETRTKIEAYFSKSKELLVDLVSWNPFNWHDDI